MNSIRLGEEPNSIYETFLFVNILQFFRQPSLIIILVTNFVAGINIVH